MNKKTKKKLARFYLLLKAKTSTICLVAMFLLVLAFTVACLIIFSTTGAEPSTLIVSFFALMTGECGMLALIRTTKEKYSNEEESDGDTG